MAVTSTSAPSSFTGNRIHVETCSYDVSCSHTSWWVAVSGPKANNGVGVDKLDGITQYL